MTAKSSMPEKKRSLPLIAKEHVIYHAGVAATFSPPSLNKWLSITPNKWRKITPTSRSGLSSATDTRQPDT